MGRVNMEKGRVQAGTGIPVFSNVRFGYVGYWKSQVQDFVRDLKFWVLGIFG